MPRSRVLLPSCFHPCRGVANGELCAGLAHVAQSVEHLHGKQKVSGSIPLAGSTTSDRTSHNTRGR